jgi:hypothetical protein
MIVSDSDEDYTHTPTGTGITPDSYAFGVPETYRGVSPKKMDELQNLNYDTFKQDINYPKNKQLAIYIYDGTDLSQNPRYKLEPPSEQTSQKENVYVTQWSAWLLEKDSTKQLITISIQTW